MVAADFIGGDDFLCLSGDDLLLRNDSGSDLADMVTHWERAGTAAALAAAVVPGDSASRYGVLLTRQQGEDLLLDRLVEKPADYAETIAHAYISRGVFPGEFMAHLDKLQPSPASGEYQITDAIVSLAADRDVLIHPVAGAYLDCGDPAGLLAANLAAARAAGIAIPE
jgi:UTP--glucose-1-phosphate uridylyltransferase